MNYEEAVRLAKNKQEEGFRFLYESTYKKSMFYAKKYMSSDAEAEDVVQDSYIKAFNKLDSLQNPERFPAWMGMIVTNTAKNILEKKTPTLFSELENENEEGESIEFSVEDEDTGRRPEAAFDKKETKEILAELLNALSTDQKMCIVLQYLEGYSLKEIAETMNCPENTVKTRIFNGKKR